MKMVRDYKMADIPQLAKQLHHVIRESGVIYEGVIGIERAGILLANEIAKHSNTPLCSISARRRLSGIKSYVRPALIRMPPRVLDFLRRLEQASRIHILMSRRIPQGACRLTNAATWLVVDDAIDTGNTLHAVMTTLRTQYPSEKTFYSAAVTTTSCNLSIQPDFTIHNNTICRFPWSNDSPEYDTFLDLYKRTMLQLANHS